MIRYAVPSPTGLTLRYACARCKSVHVHGPAAGWRVSHCPHEKGLQIRLVDVLALHRERVTTSATALVVPVGHAAQGAVANASAVVGSL